MDSSVLCCCDLIAFVFSLDSKNPIAVGVNGKQKPKKEKMKKNKDTHQVEKLGGWCVDHNSICTCFQVYVVPIEYDSNEILAYEEVVMVNPDPSYERPIVLIG